jgi:hypothetical protein
MTAALCQGMPLAEVDRLFFANPGTDEERQAKALCLDCPLYWPCQEAAINEGIPDGVFGGTGPRDRARIWHAMGAKPQSPWVRFPPAGTKLHARNIETPTMPDPRKEVAA